MRTIATFLLLTLLPAVASAQLIGAPDEEQRGFASPQYFHLEFKFGGYLPDIDSEFDNGKTPFADLFGDDLGFMFKTELAVEIWRPFGTISLGGVAGYYTIGAAPFKDTGDDTTPSSTSSRLTGETELTLVPLALLLIYRADFLYSEWRVPVIPYVKFGINYHLWWISKGNGDTATFGGEEASGGTFGWQVNAGVSLLLDVFQPSSAKTLDTDTGINHTYLFFEFVHVQADGFGSDNVLHVGDTAWQGGLAFAF